MAKGSRKAKTEDTAPQASGTTRSIVDPKYRDRYKNREADFVTQLITDTSVPMITKQKKVGEETTEVQVKGELNPDMVLSLAKANNLDVAGLEAQAGSKNFAGRVRMTVANMLRAAAKKRHGLYTVTEDGSRGEWLEAPQAFLTERSAPEKPTHDAEGKKIVVARAEAA